MAKATTKAKAKATEDETMALSCELPKMEIGFFSVGITGDTPLVVNRWIEKAQTEMLKKQMKKATNGKDAKNPVSEFINRLYWLDENGNDVGAPDGLINVSPDTPYEEVLEHLKNGRFGFPACAFKACAIDAGYQQGVIPKKTTARGAFHVVNEFAVIEGTPEMREDMVKVGTINRTADIRFRPEFRSWKTTLLIRYNKKSITPEQIVNLLNYGGFSNGVGEWRPEHNGSFGMFHCE